MGEKSVRKREFIVKKARAVFAGRGYKDVTMKDIVEACEISRGGLYLYFDSTRELFLEVLKQDMLSGSEEDDVFSQAIRDHAPSSDILALFLQEQKKELCNTEESLTVATYEFFFDNKFAGEENPVRQRFEAAVQIIEKLIRDGLATGEFVCEDPKGAARNIMYVLEGLRVMSQTVGITEKAVNREILYLMRGLLKEV